MMSRKDKQSEKRERTKSWGLYQTSNKEEKKRDKLRSWSNENWK